MKSTRTLAVLPILLLALLLVACGDDDDDGAADATVDSGVTPDFYSDTSFGDIYIDTGGTEDTGTVTDLTVDSGQVGDSTVDTGTVGDSTVDTGTVVDTGPTVDTGPVADTGSTADTSMDGVAPGDTGPAPDVTLLPNNTCTAPEAITMTGSSVTVSSDTTGQGNEFGSDIYCSGFLANEGPQLYYSMDLSQGTQYMITVTPDSSWDPSLYIFQDTTCDPVTIDSECAGSGGAFMDSGLTGDAESLFFEPPVTGTYIIAVDSWDSGVDGPFDLTIERVQAPTNDTCAAAEGITMSGGTATVSGSNAGSTDTVDLTASGCTGVGTAGGDVFYTVDLTGGQDYKITVVPTGSFDPAVYVITDCANPTTTCVEGVDGTSGGSSEKLTFQPAADGTYIIVVDSEYLTNESAGVGSFDLTIEELTIPGNDTCGHAVPMTLVSGAASESGDSADATHTDPGISSSGCTGWESRGPDLYYSVDLIGGSTYTVTVTPDANWDPMLYAFTDCADMEGTCEAGSDSSLTGGAEAITLAPTVDTTYYIAVDSYYGPSSSSSGGTFTLDVQVQ